MMYAPHASVHRDRCRRFLSTSDTMMLRMTWDRGAPVVPHANTRVEAVMNLRRRRFQVARSVAEFERSAARPPLPWQE
jgi:hypothetical protein